MRGRLDPPHPLHMYTTNTVVSSCRNEDDDDSDMGRAHVETDKQLNYHDDDNNNVRGSRLGKDRLTENVVCEIGQTTR